MKNVLEYRTVVLLALFTGLMGLGMLGRAFENPITSFEFWWSAVIGAALLFVTWSLVRVVDGFAQELGEYHDALRQLGYENLNEFWSRRRNIPNPDSDREEEDG